MGKRLRTGIVVVTALTAATVFGAIGPNQAAGEQPGGHEVWLVDQSNSTATGGGRIYIYGSAALRPAHASPPAVIDLGGTAHNLCMTATGTAPVRPHMMFFGPGDGVAVLAYVASGHVLFIDGPTRAPLACIDVGVQAHAAVPAPDGSSVVVANQNGKLLQRITSDFDAKTFSLAPSATLDLANCTTPSGAACQDAALRPDNAPICAVVDSTSRFAFVTLRGGGLFVADITATPMRIVAEYDKATVHPNGCGGVEFNGQMYINAGGGTAANPLESDLYAFPLDGFDATPNAPNTPAPTVVFSQDDLGTVESHGTTLVSRGRLLWVADRAANKVVVVSTTTNQPVGGFDLTGPLSSDPAPDLMDVSPNGQRVYIALRGPVPLTGNVPGVDNAVGSTPGLAVVQVQGSGGKVLAVLPVTNKDANKVERADPHAVRVRRT